MELLFSNITALTMEDGAPVMHGAYLGVDSGKICYLDTAAPTEKADRVIDGAGRIVMPGLINCHTHLPMTLMRGYGGGHDLQSWLSDYIFPAEDKLDSRSVRCATQLAIAECLAGGVTSVSDMYTFCGDILRVVDESGIKANISRGTTLFADEFSFDDFPACRELEDIHKRWHMHDDGRIKIEVSIHGEYTSDHRLWDALSEYAINNSLGMHVHLSETRSEHESCVEKNGLTPAQVLDCHNVFTPRAIAAHGVYLTDEDMDLLTRRGTTVVHNPTSNCKLASGVARVTELLRRGVNVALGTDGVSSNNSVDMFAEMKLAVLLQNAVTLDPQALSALDALKMATVGGAKAQGREDECGRLRVGMDADVVMLDAVRPNLIPCHDVIENLVFSAHSGDVVLTMVKGRILYENGRFLTLDLPAVRAEIERYAMPLVFG